MRVKPADTANIRVTINGEPATATVPVRLNLADFLRERGLTGTHVGCEHGACGACTVLVEGMLVRGCLMLAVQCDGRTVETIEGAYASGRLDRLTQAFHARNALQCGFCTPAMLLTVASLLDHTPRPTRDEVRDWISGNLCRCTGYQAIVDAVMEASA